MSSRALRRLQRERDTELCSVSRSSELKGDDTEAIFEEITPYTADSVVGHESVDSKSPSGPRNMFDLVIAICCNFDFDVQILQQYKVCCSFRLYQLLRLPLNISAVLFPGILIFTMRRHGK